MSTIYEDPDVRVLMTPNGLDVGRLDAPDAGLVSAWAAKEILAQGEPPPEDALRASVLAGIWAYERLSPRAEIGWRKLLLFLTALNATVWEKSYASDAGIYVEWGLSTIEQQGWGPDGNASPLGRMHSQCMGNWHMRQDSSGKYVGARPQDGRDAATEEILTALGVFARARYLSEIDPFDDSPIERMLRGLPADEAESFIATLAPSAIARDGWVLYGTADAVLSARGDCDDLASYRKVMGASLRSRRARNFWDSDLSPKESVFWMSLNDGDMTWLPTQAPPSMDTATITPLAVGEERVLATLSPWSDSNLVLVERRAEAEYVAINDMAVERDKPERGRTRRENDVAASLYEVYAQVGPQIPMPPHDVDPEFEPFLRHPRPRLPEEHSASPAKPGGPSASPALEPASAAPGGGCLIAMTALAASAATIVIGLAGRAHGRTR